VPASATASSLRLARTPALLRRGHVTPAILRRGRVTPSRFALLRGAPAARLVGWCPPTLSGSRPTRRALCRGPAPTTGFLGGRAPPALFRRGRVPPSRFALLRAAPAARLVGWCPPPLSGSRPTRRALCRGRAPPLGIRCTRGAPLPWRVRRRAAYRASPA